MDVSRIFLKTANSLLSAVIVLFLVVAGGLFCNALWDNIQLPAFTVTPLHSSLAHTNVGITTRQFIM